MKPTILTFCMMLTGIFCLHGQDTGIGKDPARALQLTLYFDFPGK